MSTATIGTNFEGESLAESSEEDAVEIEAEEPDLTTDPRIYKAAGLASGAVVLLITLVVIAMAALVGGEFLNAIPSDSAFSGSITTLTDNAQTSFTIFGVALLAIPAVAVLTYIVMNLGGFMDLGMAGRFGRGGR